MKTIHNLAWKKLPYRKSFMALTKSRLPSKIAKKRPRPAPVYVWFYFNCLFS